MVRHLIIQVLLSRFQVLLRAPLEQPYGFINGVLLSTIAVSLKNIDTDQRCVTDLPANTQHPLGPPDLSSPFKAHLSHFPAQCLWQSIRR